MFKRSRMSVRMRSLCLLIVPHSRLCSFLLVVVAAGAAAATATAAAAGCDRQMNASTQCANLGNISYPFADTRQCAVSRSFVLSNCSSNQAYWNAFTEAYWPENNHSPPAVMAIHRAGPIIFLDITWDKALIGSPSCAPPFSNVTRYFPYPFKLSYLDSYAFQFSPHSIYLLLNCSWVFSLYKNAQANTPLCNLYQQQCNMFRRASCIQYYPIEELLLEDALNSYQCTHFQFFVSMDSSLAVDQWHTGLVQLAHTDILCQACESTHGSCIFDSDGVFRRCSCNDTTDSDTYCIIKPECIGALCNPSARIALAVCVPITTISLLVIVAIALYQYYKRKQKRVVDGTPAERQNIIEDRATITNVEMNRMVQGVPVNSSEQPQPESTIVLANIVSSTPLQILQPRNDDQYNSNEVGHE